MPAKKLGTAATLLWIAALGAQSAAAEETLRALSMFPKPVAYTQSFLTFIERLNAAGEGVVQIEFVGGPEAIPTFDQAEALRTGVIDMVYGPGSFYGGLVP
jgi:TRAP-type C4-dicarboxylate transport system substrate-binding protein